MTGIQRRCLSTAWAMGWRLKCSLATRMLTGRLLAASRKVGSALHEWLQRIIAGPWVGKRLGQLADQRCNRRQYTKAPRRITKSIHDILERTQAWKRENTRTNTQT